MQPPSQVVAKLQFTAVFTAPAPLPVFAKRSVNLLKYHFFTTVGTNLDTPSTTDVIAGCMIFTHKRTLGSLVFLHITTRKLQIWLAPHRHWYTFVNAWCTFAAVCGMLGGSGLRRLFAPLLHRCTVTNGPFVSTAAISTRSMSTFVDAWRDRPVNVLISWFAWLLRLNTSFSSAV
jgi:hypothetical protein